MLRTTVVLVLALIMTSAGCADEPDPEEARMSVDASRTRVQTAVRDTAEQLSAAGHTIDGATGKWRVCSAEPIASWQYSAGGLVTSARTGSVADAIAAIAEVMQGHGWVVESEGIDPEPYANLQKEGLRLALGESRRAPGAVALGVKDECIDTTEEQDSLLGEEDRVLG